MDFTEIAEAEECEGDNDKLSTHYKNKIRILNYVIKNYFVIIIGSAKDISLKI